MLEWSLIADDVTGGLEAGVAFLALGAARLLLPGAPEPEELPATLILDTESRSLSIELAAARASGAARRLQRLGARRVYKKIDSGLRGPWVYELEAVRRTMAVPMVVIAPAYPAMGRVMRGGRVYVAGAPLEATPFGTASSPADHLTPLNLPVERIPLVDVRAGETRVAERLAAARAQNAAYVIADAERDEDLRTLARATTRLGMDTLCCGSGGWAAALARVAGERVEVGSGGGRGATTATGERRAVDLSPPAPLPGAGRGERGLAIRLPLPAPQGGHPPPPLVRGGGKGSGGEVRAPLLVTASRHPVSHRQVARVVAGGGTFCFWLPESADEATAARLAADVRTAVQAGRPCAIAVEPGDGEEKPALVALLAQAIVSAMEGEPPAALIATGGETAFQMLAAARASGVELEGEWRPGVPYGTVAGGPWQGLPLFTKTGDYGDEETLLDLVAALT